MRISKHCWRGCKQGPWVPSYKKKGEGLPIFPNVKTIAIAKKIENGEVLVICNQIAIDTKHDRSIYPMHGKGQGELKEKTSNNSSDQTRDHLDVEELSTYIDVNAPTLVRKWRTSSSKEFGRVI